MSERIAILGLGYVGLPVALALAQVFDDVTGFDISEARVAALREGRDATGEVSPDALCASRLLVSSDSAILAGVTFFIVTVPTPIDGARRPDLAPLKAACRTIAPHLRPGAAVVFESTVYPGVTEDVCGRLLAELSDLRCGVDFTLGYSPERINPGDKHHGFADIVKVISAQDEATLERVAAVYGPAVHAGLFGASSIKVAEAAKVIENTQRDLNIALMNELAIINDRLGIRTADVLAAARTKWNFLPFRPGLVGGHCIGVDPYYLTAIAEELGYNPQVILAGRRINDSMGRYVAERTIKLIAASGSEIRGARVGILGLAFKEDVPDLRNSRVPEIVEELRAYGAEPLVHDPLVDPDEALREHGLRMVQEDELRDLSAIVVAVPHRCFRAEAPERLLAGVRAGGVVIDVTSMLDVSMMPAGVGYWSL
ncbi:nucleotide sugar dehydrogenase [Aurantimonas sp. C2-6-R+9]|uniref:nucleotide sugar dehydrogenase n=1 Tax=unclassified Aurantimonas TaxID=2638230 RepID=UPI002E198DA8|nr:nucleotide sugar dehydrogenase [Aurantimonas sp. C2-6-R+9]